MRIAIAGASGLVGSALAKTLRAEGHEVTRIVRPGRASTGAGGSPMEEIPWDPSTGKIDLVALEGADAVVHLGGSGIAEERWTAARKEILRKSRVESTRLLVDAMAGMRRKPRAFVCASAIGYYGNRGDEILTETSGSGTDFLSGVAREWEGEALRAEASGTRTVRLRFGVILAAEGGALPRMAMPFRFGAGGRLGSGRQWMSWITLEDAVEAARATIVDERWSGALNVVAPEAVRNEEFKRALARVLRRPAIFPAPAFALRLALGEMADALLLVSQRVKPQKLMEAGFPFRFVDLEPALRAKLRGR